tara:strand:+ start:73 stop:366 length:294 start_codon:yes stop_codon:yes gene_type:complete
MKKLLVLLSLLLATNAWAESVNGFEVEPLNCIAALSIGRDAAEITGDKELFGLLTDVQNNIYLLLPDFPKYSLIQSRKKALGSNPTDLMLACIEEYQ